VALERCLKISTAILSVCRCLSNDDISDSIRAIAAINPPSTTGGCLLGLVSRTCPTAQLAWCTTWYLREETLKPAIASIVNRHHRQSLAQL
jgi:hypothetical protein